jgi:hypothetical protein
LAPICTAVTQPAGLRGGAAARSCAQPCWCARAPRRMATAGARRAQRARGRCPAHGTPRSGARRVKRLKITLNLQRHRIAAQRAPPGTPAAFCVSAHPRRGFSRGPHAARSRPGRPQSRFISNARRLTSSYDPHTRNWSPPAPRQPKARAKRAAAGHDDAPGGVHRGPGAAGRCEGPRGGRGARSRSRADWQRPRASGGCCRGPRPGAAGPSAPCARARTTGQPSTATAAALARRRPAAAGRTPRRPAPRLAPAAGRCRAATLRAPRAPSAATPPPPPLPPPSRRVCGPHAAAADGARPQAPPAVRVPAPHGPGRAAAPRGVHGQGGAAGLQGAGAAAHRGPHEAAQQPAGGGWGGGVGVRWGTGRCPGHGEAGAQPPRCAGPPGRRPRPTSSRSPLRPPPQGVKFMELFKTVDSVMTKLVYSLMPPEIREVAEKVGGPGRRAGASRREPGAGEWGNGGAGDAAAPAPLRAGPPQTPHAPHPTPSAPTSPPGQQAAPRARGPGPQPHPHRRRCDAAQRDGPHQIQHHEFRGQVQPHGAAGAQGHEAAAVARGARDEGRAGVGQGGSQGGAGRC